MFPMFLIFKKPFLLLLLTLFVAFLNANNFGSCEKEGFARYKPPNKTSSLFYSAYTLKAANHFKAHKSGLLASQLLCILSY